MKKSSIILLLSLSWLLYLNQNSIAQSRASIRGDGTLMVDGKSVFPVGVRSEKLYEIQQVSDCGFNLILGSGEWTDKHYAQAHKNKLIIMAGHHVWATFKGTKAKIDLRLKGEKGLKNVMRYASDQSGRKIPEALKLFDGRPGVIGWLIADEPKGSLTEILEHGYEIIKSYNPNHLVSIFACDQQWYGSYRNACDVLMVDLFPLRGKDYPHKRASSISDTYNRIKQAVDVMGDKAVWYMPQLYPPSHWRPFNDKEELTLQDMRLPVYASLIAGVKGIVFYHWGVIDKTRVKTGGNSMETYSAKWVKAERSVVKQRKEKVKKLVAELHTLGKIICDGRPNNDLNIRWVAPGINGPGPQYTRTIEYDGKQYLFVLNLLDTPIEAEVYGHNVESNVFAYDAKVFVGQEYLSVADIKPGQPRIKIAPRGSGVFVFTRRSIIKR